MNATEEVKNNNLYEAIKSRFSDPIVGTYILSFLVFNWKVLVLLFSSIEVTDKIDRISRLLTVSFTSEIWSWTRLCEFTINQYTVSLYFTLVYLFFLPKHLAFAYNYLTDLKIKNTNERYERECKLLPVAARIKQLEERLNEEIQKSDSKNELLSTKENEVKSLKSTVQNETSLRKTKEKEVESLNKRIFSLENSIKSYGNEEHLQKLKDEIIEKEWGPAFQLLTNYIITNNPVVGAPHLSDHEKLLAFLATNSLIERHSKNLGKDEYWRITDDGKKLKSLF